MVQIRRLLCMSGSGCATLKASQLPIAPPTVARKSTFLRNFVHVVSPFTLEVFLPLSLQSKFFFVCTCTIPSQDTSHSEFHRGTLNGIKGLCLRAQSYEDSGAEGAWQLTGVRAAQAEGHGAKAATT